MIAPIPGRWTPLDGEFSVSHREQCFSDLENLEKGAYCARGKTIGAYPDARPRARHLKKTVGSQGSRQVWYTWEAWSSQRGHGHWVLDETLYAISQTLDGNRLRSAWPSFFRLVIASGLLQCPNTPGAALRLGG